MSVGNFFCAWLLVNALVAAVMALRANSDANSEALPTYQDHLPH